MDIYVDEEDELEENPSDIQSYRRMLAQREPSPLFENPPKSLYMEISSEPSEDAMGEIENIVESYDVNDWWGDMAYGMDYPEGGYSLTVMTKSTGDAMRLRNDLLGWQHRHGLRGRFNVGDSDYDYDSEIQPNPSATPLFPNRGARSLGDRPSMKTSFGDTLDDPDSIRGARGKSLDKALDRYQTFHAKSPIRVAELAHDLPTRWTCVGDGLAVMYRTDKWKKDGVDEDYKHLHDKRDGQPYERMKGVRFYEPDPRGTRLPVPIPKAITLLGYCLGAFLRKDSDGHEYETNPRGCYLFSAPDGHSLFIYSPGKQSDGSDGFMAALVGGNLRVLKDGIDG